MGETLCESERAPEPPSEGTAIAGPPREVAR